jgi:hypothetical protein
MLFVLLMSHQKQSGVFSCLFVSINYRIAEQSHRLMRVIKYTMAHQ